MEWTTLGGVIHFACTPYIGAFIKRVAPPGATRSLI